MIRTGLSFFLSIEMKAERTGCIVSHTGSDCEGTGLMSAALKLGELK